MTGTYTLRDGDGFLARPIVGSSGKGGRGSGAVGKHVQVPFEAMGAEPLRPYKETNMPLNEYKLSTAFTGVIGRTCDVSSPA